MAVDFKDFERRMNKALDHLNEEFGAVRAGRANPKVLDRITVEYSLLYRSFIILHCHALCNYRAGRMQR